MEATDPVATRGLAVGFTRVVLAVNLLVLVELAVWPLLSPRGFYDNFPGGGFHWVDINGPYNEHLIRDFGALNAALAVLAAFALWKASTELLQAAGIALAVYALPHAIYHLQNLGVYESDERIVAVAPLLLQFVGGVLIAWLSSGRRLLPSSRARTPSPDRRI